MTRLLSTICWLASIRYGMFLNVRAAAPAPIKKGDALSIVNGEVKKWATGENDRCYCDEERSITAAAGDLIRVVIK